MAEDVLVDVGINHHFVIALALMQENIVPTKSVSKIIKHTGYIFA
jgi:hypothetical protein